MKKRIIAASFALVFSVTALFGCGTKNLSDNAGTGSYDDGETSDADGSDEKNISDEAGSSYGDVGTDAPQALIFSDYYAEYDDDGTYLFGGISETIRLDNDSSYKYKGLSDALNKTAEADSKRSDEEASEYTAEAKEYHAEAGEYFHPMSVERKIYPRRSDGKVFSYLSLYSADLGGAHGSTYYGGYNFDTATGNMIALSDVIADKAMLSEEILKRVKRDYPDLLLAYDDESGLKDRIDESLSDEYEESLAWVLDPYCITFCFGDYALGAYANGHQIISIRYEEAPSLFLNDYSPIKDRGYIVSFPTWMDNNFDIDGDGELECIRVTDEGIYDEDIDYYEESHKRIDVLVGEKEKNIAEDWDVFGVDCRMAIMPSGKSYLMVTEELVNDYTATKLMGFAGGEPVIIKENAFEPKREKADTDDYGRYALLNTDELILSLRFDRLATFDASRTYRLNEDGSLSSDEEYYMIVEYGDNVFETETLIDITADIVDEDGNVVEEGVTFPAGTVFYLYRTKGERNYEDYHDVIVDAKLSDGRIVSFVFTEGDWPHKVNGIDENMVFKYLNYAG